MSLLLRFTEGVTQPERNDTAHAVIKPYYSCSALSCVSMFAVFRTKLKRNSNGLVS